MKMICKQHGNIIQHLQKFRKECIYLKYLIYAALTQFEIWCNLRVFPARSVLPKFQSLQKQRCSASLARGESTVCMTTVQYQLFVIFFLNLPLPSLLLFTYSIILCIKINHKPYKIRTTFIKIAQQMNFKRSVFAMPI